MLKWLGDIYSLVFARPCFRRFNTLLYHLGLRGLGILNYETSARSGESSFIRERITGLKAAVILDVGANVGAYSRRLRDANAGATIYAFEPHPLTYAKLQENSSGLGILTVNAGVGSAAGTLNLFDYADQDGSSHASLYREVIESLRQSDAVEHEVAMILSTWR